MVLCLCLAVTALLPLGASAEAEVTRGEWISKLVGAFSMSVQSEADMPDNYFSDVTADMANYRDILLAVEFGVIDLEAGEAFEPDKPATREFAAQTLNFCLKFQLDKDTEYTYSEAEEVSCPDDIQVAVNRGWFALYGNDFMPKQSITAAEAEAMLADAKSVLSKENIDKDYDSKYKFADNVKVIPSTADVSISTDYTVTVTGYECGVNAGDVFVAYSAGIPVVLKAIDVKTDTDVTTITADADDAEGVITSVDSEGVAEFDLENFETAEVETYSVTDADSHDTSEMQISLQSINYDKKAKKLIATKEIKVSGTSNAGSITVEVSDINLFHKENTNTGEYMAYIQGNTSITKSISFDIGNYVGIPSSITLGYINISGIGSVTLNVDLSLKGGMSSNETGIITAGFSYARNDGFRLINGYKKTAYSFTAEAEVKVGLTLSANIDLVVMSGRIWATVGVKGYFKFKDYTYVDGERPLQCKTIGGFLYANVGASASINYFIDKKSWSKTVDIYTESNSPVRVYYHYEDNQLVDACTRGRDNNEAYIKYTTHTNSAYFNPSPSYGRGSYTGGDGTTKTLWTYTTDSEGNATITGYSGSASSLAIPSVIDGYKVTKIGDSAFENNKKIRSVTIPDTVIEIGGEAFDGCTALSDVKLSKNIVTLEYNVFCGCTSLTSIEIPASLQDAGSSRYIGTFAKTGLQNVTFEDGITKIPSNLFRNCTSLKSIDIPETVALIESSVFYGCSSLTNIDIPDSVTGMGEYVFSDCISLEKVKLPNTRKNIMAGTFYDCKSLKDIALPETVTEIRRSAFYGCASLSSINLPDTVTEIDDYAFYGCNSLSSMKLPNNLQTIGNNAFYECKALTDITIPKNVTYVGSQAFYNCDGLQKAVINASGTIGSQAFYDCDELASLTLSDGVTKIGSELCYSCDKLTDIKFGKYITEIPDSAFRKCASLQTVTLPRFCKTVASNAFAEDTKLTEAYVPISVTGIQTNSFSYPKKMTMYGKDGSYAQEYAAGRDMPFGIVDKPITTIAYTDSEVKMSRYATVLPSMQIMPEFDTDTITFSSDNTNVATVSENGTIKAGYTYGTANVTAKTTSGLSANIKVTVVKPASTITLNKSALEISACKSEKLTATISPSDSTDNIVWTSDNADVAAVDKDGNVTGIKKGSATVTAKAVYGNVSVSCLVTVEESGVEIVNVTGVALAPGNAEITIGKTLKLSASVLPENATNKLLVWSSSNSNVVSVSADGIVTAKTLGTAKITVKTVSGSYESTCTVTVVPKVEITEFSCENMGGYGLIKLSAVNVPQSCEVFIAAYGANQKVTSIKKLTLSNGSVQTIIPLENVDKLKAFIWDFKNLKPLAVSKTK